MVIIGGDLNGHVGKEVDVYDGVHGGLWNWREKQRG